MGMGGRTIHGILLEGQSRLKGASLLLSAHTDLHLIRSAVQKIGYHLDREEPCFAAGRYYLVLRAVPGKREISAREIRLGGPLFSSRSAFLLPFQLSPSRKELPSRQLRQVPLSWKSTLRPTKALMLLLTSSFFLPPINLIRGITHYKTFYNFS